MITSSGFAGVVAVCFGNHASQVVHENFGIIEGLMTTVHATGHFFMGILCGSCQHPHVNLGICVWKWWGFAPRKAVGELISSQVRSTGGTFMDI